MTTFPVNMRLRAIPSYPSRIVGGDGISATTENGHVTIDLAHGDFGLISAVPISPTNSILTYDTATGEYANIPSSLLGGAVAGIGDAPSDATFYGRKSAGWVHPAITDVTGLQAALTAKAALASPVFTGNPTAPTPAVSDNDTSIATTAFVTAAVAASAGVSTGALRYDIAQTLTTPQQTQATKNVFKPFGCVGDGVTDDLAALVAYRNAVIADGSKTMILSAGTYAISGKLELGFSGLKVIPLGKVVFKHTGAGVAISFDAGPSWPTQALDIEFGWGNDIYVDGNAATTDLVYIRSCHHMRIGVNVRNGTTGMRINFSVCSQIRLTCSGNQGAFTKIPTNGLVTAVREANETVTDCVFYTIIENVIGDGILLGGCVGCEFRGTSEGNARDGVLISGTSHRNTFIGFDCEANGNDWQDWNIEGHYNTFIECIGVDTTSTLENIVSGHGNMFIGGVYTGMTVHALAAGNIMKGVQLLGTPVLNSASATYEACTDGSGNPVGDAWLPYTSTFSATTGTATVTARQKTIGKTIYVNIVIATTSAITGTMTVTLPVAPQSYVVISGKEIAVGGLGAEGYNNASGSTVMLVRSSAFTQFLDTGLAIVLTGSYEAA